LFSKRRQNVSQFSVPVRVTCWQRNIRWARSWTRIAELKSWST